MKKVFLFVVEILIFGAVLQAQTKTDSLKNVRLEEIVVSSTRAGKKTPVAYSNVSADKLKQNNAGKNIPLVLEKLPSLVAFTEDGLGVGNTSLRIRGTDATRINITLNGMPLNNPESQEVYWVNLPDLSSSLQSVQLQRGVGTSTNGSAAFGASLSLKTLSAKTKAYGEASTSIGSYNTFLSSIAAGTGLFDNGLALDLRYSRVLGDGYIERGSVNHKNFFASLSHYTNKQLIKLIYINGIQKTGITWEGISPEQMKKYGRRYNPAGKHKDEAGNTHFYKNETDNYYSNIAQLIFSRELSDAFSLNANFSYNNGFGYYENYKSNKKYKSFGLENQQIDSLEYKRSDLIRKKLMSNDFYVANLSVNYNQSGLKATFGGMYSFYDGIHYGNIPWFKYNKNIPENYEWYRNVGKKQELNFFAKAEYQITEGLSAFADLQYRTINYNFSGIDDDLEDLKSKNKFNFFNPKAGLFFQMNDKNSFYASFAIGQREPLRTDLKNSIKKGGEQKILPEKMFDYELGYRFDNQENTSFSVNLYYMDYDNQMVQTGKLNDVGYKIMENVKNSYRTGIEIEFSTQLFSKLQIDANATLSQNKIKKYNAYFDIYDNPNNYNWLRQEKQELKSTHISFSPNFIAMANLRYNLFDELFVSLSAKYVGKQYYDNTSNDKNALDAYFVNNFSAGYSFKKMSFGTISLELFANNIFNQQYIANAWVATDKFDDGSEIAYKGFYPQAMRNFMMRMTIKF